MTHSISSEKIEFDRKLEKHMKGQAKGDLNQFKLNPITQIKINDETNVLLEENSDGQFGWWIDYERAHTLPEVPSIHILTLVISSGAGFGALLGITIGTVTWLPLMIGFGVALAIAAIGVGINCLVDQVQYSNQMKTCKQELSERLVLERVTALINENNKAEQPLKLNIDLSGCILSDTSIDAINAIKSKADVTITYPPKLISMTDLSNLFFWKENKTSPITVELKSVCGLN